MASEEDRSRDDWKLCDWRVLHPSNVRIPLYPHSIISASVVTVFPPDPDVTPASLDTDQDNGGDSIIAEPDVTPASLDTDQDKGDVASAVGLVGALRVSSVAFLPREIVENIMSQLVLCSFAYLGLLRSVCSQSERWQGLVDSVLHQLSPSMHIAPDLLLLIGGTLHMDVVGGQFQRC